MGELSSVSVERASLRVDLNGMTTLVECMKEDVGKSLSNLSTENAENERAYGRGGLTENSRGSRRRMEKGEDAFSSRVRMFSGKRKRRTVKSVLESADVSGKELRHFQQSRDQDVICG